MIRLSVLVPAIPGRLPRLRAIIRRVSRSAKSFGLLENEVEIVIVDGGEGPAAEALLSEAFGLCRVKYVYLPIGGFVCAAYPRNVGLRVCEGDVIGHLDVDHFPSENIVEGMLRPFIEGLAVKDINRGYVIDSSKSPLGAGPNVWWLESINRQVLGAHVDIPIGELYSQAKIPPPGINNTLWIWSAKQKYLRDLNGYEELFCRRGVYGREEDDWRQRMLANGMPLWDGANKQFCAIHLWHPAAHRVQASNELNRDLFTKLHGIGEMNVDQAKIRSVVAANQGWEWGKLLKGSFSVIGGIVRNEEEHERWVSGHTEHQPYLSTWSGMEEFYEKLEERANVR